jgi:hypothetical protein
MATSRQGLAGNSQTARPTIAPTKSLGQARVNHHARQPSPRTNSSLARQGCACRATHSTPRWARSWRFPKSAAEPPPRVPWSDPVPAKDRRNSGRPTAQAGVKRAGPPVGAIWPSTSALHPRAFRPLRTSGVAAVSRLLTGRRLAQDVNKRRLIFRPSSACWRTIPSGEGPCRTLGVKPWASSGARSNGSEEHRKVREP